MKNVSPLRAVIALAGAKIVVAAVAFCAAALTGTLGADALPLWTRVLMVAAYGAVGTVLVTGGHQDPRCSEFGVFLLLVAAAFSDVLGRAGHPLGGLTAVALALHLDVFLPAFLWLFVRDFPARAPLGWAFRVPAQAARLSLVVGAMLWIANLPLDLAFLSGNRTDVAWLEPFARSRSGGLYWPTLFLLMMPAAPVLIARGRRVGPGERRRVMVFVGAVLAGLLPIALDVTLRATSAFWTHLVSAPAFNATVIVVVLAALVSVPFTTAYAVLVARVGDLRLIIRSALQYSLARYSALALVGVPGAWLAWYVYRHRFMTVEALLFGRVAVLVVLGVALIVTALRLRRSTLVALDRRFFREHYDAQQILTGLVEASRRADTTERFAVLMASEIDRALHLERVTVLIRHDGSGQFVARDGRTRPLPCESALAKLLNASDEPLDLEPDNPKSVLRRLDEAEVAWLADGGFRLLVPLRGAAGTLVGVLALGEKKSELAYSPRDRDLLAAVGASGGLYLESRRMLRTPRPDGGSPSPLSPAGNGGDDAGQECPVCGLVHDPGVASCTCGSRLVAASVPRMLAGKFRIERRVGAGGMAVVYRAADLTLGRTVAIKALPQAGAQHTWRLRREARAMALVSHENLALIFGAESWRGRPLLVEEFLAGGTLADRIAHGRLADDAVLTLGLVLTRVLDSLHSVGLLHRDIKPSNVGFTTGGTPKLLDFGLAQLLSSEHAPGAQPGESAADSTTRPVDTPWDATRHGFGTPAYMAPEALLGQEPGPSFDLWGLSVLLFESLTGVNPFRGQTMLETLARIEHQVTPDLGAYVHDARPELTRFFKAVLAADRRQRPSSARELGRQLSALLSPP